MIVDDDEAQGSLCRDLGLQTGFEPMVIGDSARAIERIGVFKPNVLIIDLMMPGVDGVQLLRSLGDQKCRAGILIVSGADTRTLAAAKRLGESFGLDILGALSKPDALPAIRTALVQARDQAERGITAETLAEGIRNNQLVLHYQPQMSIHRRRPTAVECVEALVRWQHPKLGLLPPGTFLPMAESEGLIGELTEWVIGAAVRQSAEWARQAVDVAISINLPACSVADLGFPEHMDEIFALHGVGPERFVLEVTEHQALSNTDGSLDVLTRLRLRGFTLSIDDFGCGYSTLSTLHRMPFNELKIDRSLVAVVVRDHEAAIVTRTILGLARRMGLTVCAEGVEDQATFDVMAKWGCHKIQGFYIGRPAPSTTLDFDAYKQWASGRLQESAD